MIVQEAFSCVIDKIWIEEISNFIYDLSINTLIFFKKKKRTRILHHIVIYILVFNMKSFT